MLTAEPPLLYVTPLWLNWNGPSSKYDALRK
jgi:hypothetical protein